MHFPHSEATVILAFSSSFSSSSYSFIVLHFLDKIREEKGKDIPDERGIPPNHWQGNINSQKCPNNEGFLFSF